MAPYRLYYWKARGRGEQIRLLLNEVEQPYEDVFVRPGEELRALQGQGPKKLPFGSLPMLEDGDFRLAQGTIILSYLARKHGLAPQEPQAAARAESIAQAAEDLRTQYFRLGDEAAVAEYVSGRWSQRWLPSFSGLLELNGDTGYLVGDSLTQADIAVWEALDTFVNFVAGADLNGFPKLEEFYARIAERPRIAAYLASDRRPSDG